MENYSFAYDGNYHFRPFGLLNSVVRTKVRFNKKMQI